MCPHCVHRRKRFFHLFIFFSLFLLILDWLSANASHHISMWSRILTENLKRKRRDERKVESLIRNCFETTSGQLHKYVCREEKLGL